MASRSPPTVLITRPKDKALALSRDLEAKGYRPIIEPLLTIEPLGQMAPPPAGTQAIILTSAHAVPALSETAKHLPIFAVGKATGKAALDAGAAQVLAGDSDATALADVISRQCQPEKGPLLHLAGDVVRAELGQALKSRGFDLRREIVYRAAPRTAFSDDLLTTWRCRGIDAVLLFSPRTAEIFIRLLRDHGLASQVDRTTAICVSERAATPCRELAWREICLAPQPDREAMIRTLEGSIRIC